MNQNLLESDELQVDSFAVYRDGQTLANTMELMNNSVLGVTLKSRTYDVRENRPNLDGITNNSQITIDSLLINLPANKALFVSDELSRNVAYIKASVDDDGELCEVLEQTITDVKQSGNTIKHEFSNGSSITFGYKRLSTFVDCGGQSTDTIIQIAISSKVLGSDYHKGISHETMPIIIDAINSTGLVKVNSRCLESAFCWDVDVKRDFVCKGDMRAFLKSLYEARDRKFDDYAKGFCSTFGVHGNSSMKSGMGIQFGKRKDALHPLYKMYNKGLELITKSDAFRELNLSGIDYSSINVIREEYNIPTQTFARNIGLITTSEKLTVGKLMRLTKSQSELETVLNDCRDKYFITSKRIEEMEANEDKLNGVNIQKLNKSLASCIYESSYILAIKGVDETVIYISGECYVKGKDAKRVVEPAKLVIKRAIEDAKLFKQMQEDAVNEAVKGDIFSMLSSN